MRYYSNNYLMHHGIKGMRWGHRKYQYRDGSLTPAGEARYLKNNDGRIGREMSRTYRRTHDERNDPNIKAYRDSKNEEYNKKANRRRSEAEGLNAAANAARTAGNIANRKMGTSGTTVTREQLDSMSNADLQAAITRANLEKQYSSIYATPTVRDGMTYALQTAADVLAIAASAATVAAAIYSIRKS